jgi:signal transduction histidine kinase
VLLGRLRIRGRLAVLVNVPIVAMIVLTIAATIELSARAARADETAAAVRQAQVVSTLVRALQEERLLSIGALIGESTRGELMRAQADTDEAAAVVTGLGLPDVNVVVSNLSLKTMRVGVAAKGVTPAQVITFYSGLAMAMIESVHLLEAVDADTPQGQQVLALDGVIRANEGFATILAAMAAPNAPDILPVYISGLTTLQPAGLRMTQHLSPEQGRLYQTVIQTFDSRLGKDFAVRLLANPGAALVNLQTPPSFGDIVTLTGAARMVESKIFRDALDEAEQSASSDNAKAAGFLAFSVLTMVLAAVLGNAVGRSVVVPVLRLTRSAKRVASLAESELVRVADDDSPEAAPPSLQPIEVVGRDELADFARAFGRVQETAARLVERQVASRRNVALMFRHVGRRTQNLVGRQISLIDKLEAQETEPDRLRELYRLDHMSSRLRRSASSLVVLSGASSTDEHVAPLAVDDIVKLGLAEIEDYTRVDIDIRTPVRIAPALINDLVLLLAELMENATSFSPPGTRVVVVAESTSDGARIAVVDHGLGMSPDQITDENARLTRRERLDLAPTEVLGLFVVGRLARRHGLHVALSATPGGGVTASVDVPSHLLTERLAPAVQLTPRSAPVPLPAGPTPALPSASPAPAGPTPVAAGPMAFAADPGALDRAARTMRELRPWNAFDLATRPTSDLGTTNLGTPGLGTPGLGSLDAVPLIPSIPHQRTTDVPAVTPTWAGGPAVDRPLSTLHRRVPGATLQSLEGTGPARPVPMAPSSADQARDSLAQFESGVARAMRELDRDEGRP